MTTEKATVRPSVPTQRIVVQDERLIEMKVGDTRDLKVTAIPLLVSNKKTLSPSEAETAALLSALVTDKLEWSSSDGEIATVNENGTVCAVSAGSAKITVKSGEHEVIFNVLVEVAISDWASEEFLEYIERIGAYTELPLGTDGSAGPTAQYVTFGFTLQGEELTHFSQPPDERTETIYKGERYTKGEDDEWYWSMGIRSCEGFCASMSFEEHRQYADSFTYEYIGFEYDPDNPRRRIKVKKTGTKFKKIPCAYRVMPRKWRLLDKEKGLMVMEDYSNYWSSLGIADYHKFSYFTRYDSEYDPNHYKDHTKSAMEQISTLCDYENSYLRAWLDGGTYLKYIDLWKVEKYIDDDPKKGVEEWKRDDNDKIKFAYIDTQRFQMDTTNYYKNEEYRKLYSFKFEPYFTEKQFAQIQNIDLDCGEGGSTKGRLFILSEDEIKKYYSNGEKITNEKPGYYNSNSFCTRTRKKINGKNTLCGFTINNVDGTFKEFVQFDGYDTASNYYFIPAICVAPEPHR